MRDPQRIAPALGEIKAVWREFPDYRLGQLLVNAVGEERLFNIEDDELVEAVRRLGYDPT
jgi:hypothetical protein